MVADKIRERRQSCIGRPGFDGVVVFDQHLRVSSSIKVPVLAWRWEWAGLVR